MRAVVRVIGAALVLQLTASGAVHAQPVVPPIAPPKPAAPRVAGALQISDGDLNEAVNWARQGNLDDATTSFNLFKQDWSAEVDDVRGESDEIADSVDAAVGDLQALLDGGTPLAQSDYLPVFLRLGAAVEDANSQLGQIVPASGVLKISATNLSQSVNWASQGNLAKMHDEFGQFQDDWGLVKDAVRQMSPALADAVEAATASVAAIVSNPANPAPAQSDYYPAVQNLLQVVRDTNTQLAALGAPPAAPPVASGPVKISPGNLGESVDWASQGNLPRARSEFGQFQDDWKAVQTAVRQKSPDVADAVEAAMNRVQTILAATSPDQAAYFPALQALQQAVDDGNKKLGN